MVELTKKLKQSNRTLAQAAPDGRILLHLDSGHYFALDEVSDRVWDLLDGERTTAEIVEVICAEYDAPADRVQADVIELLEELVDAQLVVEAG